MMERAYNLGAVQNELLINHRALGHLERLPSRLIYGGKMRSGIKDERRNPATLQYIKSYFEKYMGENRPCQVPRFIIYLDAPSNFGSPVAMESNSFYNVRHIRWTMKRVEELISTPEFRNSKNAGRAGTILLLSPYKASVNRYTKAIDELDKRRPTLLVKERVESRTWDTSQGHEADIVAIDYVRDRPTTFMDGMYRFCVGLTRARQAEWHLMMPAMTANRSFAATKYLHPLRMACVRNEDGHVLRIPHDA